MTLWEQLQKIKAREREDAKIKEFGEGLIKISASYPYNERFEELKKAFEKIKKDFGG